MSQKHPERDRKRAARNRREKVAALKKVKKEVRVKTRQSREGK
jgi:hypothetical protein